MKNELNLFEARPMSLFGDWNKLQRQMNRLFDEFSGDVKDTPMSLTQVSPSCDIEETGTHFIVTVDMPGINKEDIKLDATNNMITMSGERKEEREENTKNRHLRERSVGRFYRAFTLPAEIDPQKVEAAYENGVLRIAMPKAQVTKSHQIKVSEGLSSFNSKFLKKEGDKESQNVKIQ